MGAVAEATTGQAEGASAAEAGAGFDAEIIGHGPPIVLIHGAGGSPRANFPFLDELAETFTVVAPFLPGSGSHALPDLSLSAEGIARQLGGYLARRGIREYAVVGYSMGCTIAVELAAAFPEDVRAIALTAGFVKARPSMLSFVDVWEHLHAVGGEALGRAILAAVLTPTTLDARGAEWIAESSRETALGFPPGTCAHLELLRTVDVRAALAATTQPLLVLTPEHDRLVDPAHSADIAAIRPDAIQVLLDAGHAVGDEDPRGWLAALRWFLARAD